MRFFSFWISALIGVFSTPGSTGSAHRISRATTDTLSTALDRLKAIARVTNGVYLTQELINGTNKQEEITSELLRMGSVTPTQIAKMDADELKTAIEALRDLPTTLNIQAEMQKVIQNMKAAVIIKESYVNIDSTTAWPEKAAFAAALTDVESNGVYDDVLRTLKAQLTNFNYFFNSGKTDAAKIPELLGSCNNLLKTLPKLNDSAPFSKDGSVMDTFSRVNRIIDSLTSLETIKSISIKNNNVNASFNTFFGVGDQFVKVAADLKTMNKMVSSRNLPLGLRKLLYTSGLPRGQEDLMSVQNDVLEQWMKEKINSSSFEKSLVSLKTLDSPLKTCNTKFEVFDDKVISAFNNLKFESEKFVEISSKRSDIEAALTAISSCPRTVNSFDEAIQVRDKVVELDGLFANYRANLRKAIQKMKDEEVVKKLTTLKADLEKPENNGKTLTNIYPTNMKMANQLQTSFTGMTTLFDDSLIKQKCPKVLPILDQVETGISQTTQGHTNLMCIVNIVNLDLIKEFHAILDSAANSNNPNRPDYNGAINAVKSVKSTSDSLGKVVEAIGKLKDVNSKESKMLGLLEKPKDVSDQIGKAVLGVGEIQKAIVAIPKINDLVNNLGVVMLERHSVKDKLTAEDDTQLQNLENLKFDILIQQLNTFKTAVGSKSLEKLEDSKAFFTEAKKLTGIKDDLISMSVALEKMVALSSNSATLQPAQTALKAVRNINLDFASFQGSYDPAKSSMIKLREFFVEYSKQAAIQQAQTPQQSQPSQPSQRSNGSGDSPKPEQGEVGGGKTGLSKFEKILYHYVGPSILGIFLLVIIIGGILYCLNAKKLAKLEEQFAAIEKKLRKQMEEHMAAGVAESNEGRGACRKVQPMENVAPNPNELSLEVVKKDHERLNLIAITFPPMDNVEQYITSLTILFSQHQTTIEHNLVRLKSHIPPEQQEEVVSYYVYFTMLEEFLEMAKKHDLSNGSLELVNRHTEMHRHNSHLVEESRVKVQGFADDFLHANKIWLPNGLILIAMQGPLGATGERPGKVCTCERTWQMLRQQDASDIVMLCQVDEPNGRKCAQYFPNKKGEKVTFNDIEITCISREEVPPKGKSKALGSEIIVRYLHVHYKGQKLARNYRHIQYIGWPDMKQPTRMESFLQLLGMVERCSQPVAVHCSAGIGRTGVFCYVLMAAQKLAAGKCNLYGVLYGLREKRSAMVQRPVQLAFCVQATVMYASKGREMNKDTKGKYAKITAMYDKMEHGEPRPEIGKIFNVKTKNKKATATTSKDQSNDTVASG